MKNYSRLITFVAVFLGLANTGQADDWNMPTPYSDATFHTKNIIQFTDEIEKATNGDLKIIVHSAGSLFKHPEIKNAIRSRQVQIGEFFLSRLSNEDDAYSLDSLPFLATTYEQAQSLWDAQKPVITALLEKQKLFPLFSVPWPAQGLYTNGEIQTVEDLSGLKFRAYNATLEKFATLAGAAPTQVEAPDIPQAFATGQVQAMVTSPSTGANTKAWDFVSHYTTINAWIPKNIVAVNKQVFEKLDENTRKIILETAKAAEARGWEMSKAEAEAKTNEMAENGMVVVEPSEELVAGLQEIGAQMLSDLSANESETVQSIIGAYKGE